MISAAIVLAAYAGVLDLSDRTEARVRASQGLPVAYDAVTIPSARATVTDRRWTYSLAYAPSLTLQDLQASVSPLVLHSGSAAASWRDRVARLTLREDASYGKQNTANLALVATGAPAATPVALQALPAPQTIQIASSRTTLAAELRPARRWNVGATVGYYLAGGIDEAARAVIPLQRGPLGDASVAYAVSKVDSVTGALAVSHTEFTNGPCLALQTQAGAGAAAATCAPENETATVTAGWRHAFSRTLEAAAGAGVSGVRTRLTRDRSFENNVYPAATASLGYRAGLARHVTTVRLEAQLAPIVDIRTGVADNRAQVTGTLTSRRGDVALTASLGAVRSFGNVIVAPGTFLTAATEAQYDIGRHATVGAGIRYFWQTQRGFDALSSAIGFVAFTVRSSALRF